MAGALSVTLKVAATTPGAPGAVSQFLGLARAFRALVDLVEAVATVAGLVRKHRDTSNVKVALV